MTTERAYVAEAIRLLSDNNLVWSKEFELVRPFVLHMLVGENMRTTTPRLEYVELAKELVRVN